MPASAICAIYGSCHLFGLGHRHTPYAEEQTDSALSGCISMCGCTIEPTTVARNAGSKLSASLAVDHWMTGHHDVMHGDQQTDQ